MSKVFLYLYPIEEFTKMFLFHNDQLYDECNILRPLPVLNDAINERYRKKGYQIVYALYPDKDMYGVEKYPGDRIIYTDIPFSLASAIDENGNEKKNFTPKYPNEMFLIKQIGNVDELVVGGYHAIDCVKKVAEIALQNGINTLVDLDLTDLFFNLYKQKDYFNKETYDPIKFKSHMISQKGEEYVDFMEGIFNRNYASPVYGFNTENHIKSSSK